MKTLAYASGPCILACGLAAALGGCTSAPVQPIGPDRYMVSATVVGHLTGNAAVTAVQTANAYCKKQGRTAVVESNQTNVNPFGYTIGSNLTFHCQKEPAEPAQTVLTLNAECKEQMEKAAELDAIRWKIELYRTTPDAPPPFTMAANDTYPTQVERQAIAKWASLRDVCLARQHSVSRVPPGATPMQATYLEQDWAFADELAGKVSALIVALYQGKMTYGEFAQKRYEFARDGAAAEREFRQAALIADQQRAVQAQQLAQQNFQNRLAAWSAYLQAVNSRPPQTNIHVEQNVTVR